MFTRRLAFCILALAVFSGGYLGYRFYGNPVATEESAPIAKTTQLEPNKAITATDRAFLRQTEVVSRHPREIKKRFPSLKLPAWVYKPERWNSSPINPVKVIFQQVDVVVFEAVRLLDDNMYKARPLKETMLPELGVIGDQKGVYIKNPPIPENPPDIRHHFPPRHVDPDSPDRVPKSYPLIAKIIIDQDGTPLMRLEEWIELVGGVGQAQMLLEEAGWQNSTPIETLIHQSTFEAQAPPTNRSTQR
jgi:hypothetical protein